MHSNVWRAFATGKLYKQVPGDIILGKLHLVVQVVLSNREHMVVLVRSVM